MDVAEEYDKFSYIKAISEGANIPFQMFADIDKCYDPFLTCRYFSHFPDTAEISNELNMRSTVSKHEHYTFLRKMIPPRRRKSPWIPQQKGTRLVDQTDMVIEAMMHVFDMSRKKARETYWFIREDKESINNIMLAAKKGGQS